MIETVVPAQHDVHVVGMCHGEAEHPLVSPDTDDAGGGHRMGCVAPVDVEHAEVGTVRVRRERVVD